MRLCIRAPPPSPPAAAATYAVCAALFSVGTALCVLLRYDTPARVREPVTWVTLLAGVRFIVQRKVVLGAVSLDLFAVLLGGATALALARWPVRRRSGHVLLGAVAVFGVSMLVFGLSASLWVSLAALAVSGAADRSVWSSARPWCSWRRRMRCADA